MVIAAAAEESRLIEALQREFRPERRRNIGEWRRYALWNPFYFPGREHIFRAAPLTDGYTFSARRRLTTLGRPYGEGWSTVNGFFFFRRMQKTGGRWTAYVRGEEQSAPAIPGIFPGDAAK